MLRFFTKNNGAVTVFLVLIMVPVITIATVFVDASRLRMAESIVNSSADLTLETVMAKYDAELSDYYGLLASAQDAEDIVKKANEYLVSAMTAQGLSADQANSLLATAVDKFSSDDIVDMLRLSLAEGEGSGEGAASVVSAVENGDLTNAAIVKKQISEFMKYRAPINIVADIVDKFTGFKDKIDMASTEADLVEKKKTFFQTESDLMETAYQLFKLRRQYIDCFHGVDISEYLNDMKAALNGYKEKYERYHKYLVMDLFNSENTPNFNLPNVQYKPTSTAYSDTNKADQKAIKDLAKKLENAYGDFDEARKKLDATVFTEFKGSMYSIQYWIQMMDVMNNKTDNVFTKYASAANKMTNLWADLDCALAHKDKDVDLTEKYHKSGKDKEYTLDDYISDTERDVKSAYDTYVTNTNYKYYKVGKEIEKGSQKEKVYTHDSLSLALSYILDEIKGYYSTLDDAKGIAASIVRKCSELIELAAKYERDYNSWKGAVEAVPEKKSDLADTDREEIKTNGELMKEVTDEKVSAMQTRYLNIGELLDNILVDINGYKYGREGSKKKLMDIGKFKDMRSASGLKDDEIVLDQATLESNASSTFVFEKPESLHIDDINDSNQPDTVDKPEDFENWLEDKFKGVVESKKEDGEKKKKAIEDRGEEKADDENTGVAATSDKEISEQSELPSKGGADDKDASGNDAIEKASNSISDIASNFSLEDTLEKLYALDYVMSMFTYDTYLYEGMYKNAKKLGYSGKVDTIAKAKELHDKKYYDKWNAQADNQQFRADKTLTNKVRSMDTHFSFGNEVEYILYGGTNAKNKTSAYGTIYLIRYAMNVAPMFKRGWDADSVRIPAEAISDATQKIIPATLIKVLIILALIAFESAYDIALLQQGLPVLFVKGEKDLYIDPKLENSLDEDGVVSDAADTVDDSTGTKESEEKDVKQELNQFFYSDYITLFLFIKLAAREETVYSRIADVIQVNMIKNTGNDGYRLKKAQVYYKIDANVEMPALMMKLPINQDAGIWEQMKSAKYQIKYSEIRGY